MVHRSRFDGISLLIVLGCGVLAAWFWAAATAAATPVQCPHCQNPLRGYTDPCHHRGDGV